MNACSPNTPCGIDILLTNVAVMIRLNYCAYFIYSSCWLSYELLWNLWDWSFKTAAIRSYVWRRVGDSTVVRTAREITANSLSVCNQQAVRHFELYYFVGVFPPTYPPRHLPCLWFYHVYDLTMFMIWFTEVHFGAVQLVELSPLSETVAEWMDGTKMKLIWVWLL